jgi:hypothetical protein
LPHEIELAVSSLLEEGKGESIPEGWMKNNGDLIFIGVRNNTTKRSRFEVTVKKVALVWSMQSNILENGPE